MPFIIRAFSLVICIGIFTKSYSQIFKPIYSFNEYNDGLLGIQSFFSFKDKLYYIAQTDQQHKYLYQTDGTPAGTKRLSQESFSYLIYLSANSNYILLDSDKGLLISTGGEPSLVSSQNGSSLGTIYFLKGGSESDLSDVWVSDGTGTGTKRIVKDILPESFATLNGVVFFTNRFGDNLFKYKDGSTSLVGNIMANSGLQILGVTNTKIFINSNNQIWVADEASVVSVASSGSHFISPYQVAGDKLYFVGGNTKLNVTRGVPGDVVPIAQFYSFSYVVGKAGNKIILSNGVVDTSTDTFTPVDFSSRFILTPNSNADHFYALQDSACYTRIFKYSTSDLSKTLLMDLRGKLEGQGLPIGGTVADKTVFPFNDHIHGIELWVTDGTPSGTTLLTDAITSSSAIINITNWVEGNGEYYFYTNSNNFYSSYNDLWTLKSDTNIPTHLHSFCVLPLPPVLFKENIYFSDNHEFLRLSLSSKTITPVFSKPNLEPNDILAGKDALFFGELDSNFGENVFGSHNGNTFEQVGTCTLNGATVLGDTLYQLTKGYDSLYLFRSNGVSGPLNKIRGIDLSQDVFASSLTPFATGGLLVTEQTYNTNQRAFYFNKNRMNVIETSIGSNGYSHHNDFLLYGDTIFYRVIDIAGADKYYQYLKGASAQLLFTTPTYTHSSLIGSGKNNLYYTIDNTVMKFNLSTLRADTLDTIMESNYRVISHSYRRGSYLLFQDDYDDLYFINTDKDIFLSIGNVFDAPFIASNGAVYFSRANTMWKIDPNYLITDVLEKIPENISLYPNPTSKKVFFTTELALEIFSMEGTKIGEFKTSKEFDVSFLTTGMYVAKLTLLNGRIYYRKFIKE